MILELKIPVVTAQKRGGTLFGKAVLSLLFAAKERSSLNVAQDFSQQHKRKVGAGSHSDVQIVSVLMRAIPINQPGRGKAV